MNDFKAINLILQKKRYSYLAPVLQEIESYAYAIIKGEPLSMLAYGKLGNRISTDIDVLVPKKNIGVIEKILNNHGFITKPSTRMEKIIMQNYSHQVSSWEKSMGILGKVVIDLNYDIFWGEYEGKRIDISQFLLDVINMKVYDYKIKTLPPVKAMIQLVLHHYKEMNSIYHIAQHQCINYTMFSDVYHLWKNNMDDISLEKLYALCDEYQIKPYMFYILYYTNVLYNDSELEKYVEAFCNDEGMRLLDCYGLSNSERKKWTVSFQERLDANSLYELIKNELTYEDLEKLERNIRIFG